MPEISVIIPLYNLEEYVSYCLNSILAQTFRDFELICVDDGSTDGTWKLLDEYAKKDSRIKVVHQENQGVSVARNYGMKLANGKYITFVDGDDAITPEFLEVLYREAEKSGADVTFCDYIDIVPDLKRVPEPCKEYPAIAIEENVVHVELSKKIGILPLAAMKLFRKDVLADASFIPNITLGEDQLFIYSILFRLKKVCHVKAPMYLYTRRLNSASRATFSIPKVKSYLFIYDEIIKLENQIASPIDKKLLHRKAIAFLRRILKELFNLCKDDLQEIVPQIQAYFQRWYTNKEIRFSDFKLRHRFLVLVLVKRWDKCLFGLYKLKSKAGDLNHAGRRN